MSILYSQTASLEEVQSHFRLKSAGHSLAFKRNLYINEGNMAPVITVGPGHKRALEYAEWGLQSEQNECISLLAGRDIPRWHPMMEPPRRCLIPATSFALGKDPTWFCFEEGAPFSLYAMAGVLFRRQGWLHFLMVTTLATRAASFSSRYMPLILKPDEYACWLHAPWDFTCELVEPYQNNDLQVVNPNALAKAG